MLRTLAWRALRSRPLRPLGRHLELLLWRTDGGGGTSAARYCYSVWLRHLVLAHTRGGLAQVPRTVAELGPGASFGVGLAALLSGAERYVALDVVRYGRPDADLALLDELVALFAARAPIPGPDELPDVKPPLVSYAFPTDLLGADRLEASLAPARLEALRAALRDDPAATRAARAPSPVQAFVPWDDAGVIEPGSVDLILSQAVLEHVADPARTYAAMASWLRPGGLMSHQIDYRCHGLSPRWNAHWRYGALTWELSGVRRPYDLNRLSHSQHLELQRGHGFDVLAEVAAHTEDGLQRAELAPRFRTLPAADLRTSGAYVLSRRR